MARMDCEGTNKIQKCGRKMLSVVQEMRNYLCLALFSICSEDMLHFKVNTEVGYNSRTNLFLGC